MVLPIARSFNYPLNSGHTGFRGNGGNSENTRTDEQLAEINRNGGLMGVGISSSIAPNYLKEFRYAFPRLRGVTFGSDIDGMEVMPYGRFNNDGSLKLDYNYRLFGQEVFDRRNNKVTKVSEQIIVLFCKDI